MFFIKMKMLFKKFKAQKLPINIYKSKDFIIHQKFQIKKSKKQISNKVQK